MLQVDSTGHMRVDIGGDIVRRRAQIEIVSTGLHGYPSIQIARPELREGEILCERIGMLPTIVRAY